MLIRISSKICSGSFRFHVYIILLYEFTRFDTKPVEHSAISPAVCTGMLSSTKQLVGTAVPGIKQSTPVHQTPTLKS